MRVTIIKIINFFNKKFYKDIFLIRKLSNNEQFDIFNKKFSLNKILP